MTALIAGRAGIVDVFAVAAALVVGVVLVSFGLSVDRLNGDEHNAISFLTNGLWEYIKTFHYGHLVKIQIWTLHELFGNSFFWFRVPAALSAIAVLGWLALYRVEGFPVSRTTQALVVLLLGGNVAFLNFARWGIPNYAEAILVCSILLGAVLADVIGNRVPEWTRGRLLLIAILPWLHPATVILLGGISVYLLLDATRRQWGSGGIMRMAGAWSPALVPVMIGAFSLAVFRLSIPDAHWARARHHHKAFNAWQEQGGEGEMVGFIQDSLVGLGQQFLKMPPLAGESPHQWVEPVYVNAVILVAVAVTVALAVVGWRAYRLRRSMSGIDAGFARGAMFLLTCLAAVLAVTILASAFERFPLIGLRHLFMIITLPALLAVLALAYLGHVLRMHLNDRASDLATGVGRFAVGLAVLGVGVALSLAMTTQRRLESIKYEAIQAVLQSAGNDIVFSWAPGFYYADATLVHAPEFFQVDRGSSLPGGLAQAIREEQLSPDGGTIAILTTSSMIGVASPVSRLMDDYGLRIEDKASYGQYEALALRIPLQRGREPVKKAIDITVDLPAVDIVSVRFDPTDHLQGEVAVDSIVYIDSAGEHLVNVCDDRELASMRTTLDKGEDGSCNLILGNDENTGWIAPSSLENLDADTASRQVRIRMTGELGNEFLVYVDTGAGYVSPIRVKLERAAGP